MTKRKIARKKRKQRLNVAHVVPATPHQCGMYETARELVMGERMLGVNAHIVDPRPYESEVKGKSAYHFKKTTCPSCKAEIKVVLDERPVAWRPPDWYEDRGVCVAPLSFAMNSDIIVSHSGVGDQFKDCMAPRIHLAHGRPNSSYRLERTGQSPVYSMYKKMNEDKRWRAIVTLWPGFEHYWRLLFPRIEVFPSFVDLVRWNTQPSEYDFEGLGGSPNVVIADIWRLDKDPFHMLHAFAMFAEQVPTARLHIYGANPKDGRGRDAILGCLRDRGILGVQESMVDYLPKVFNAADMVITPHRMAVRTVREALASGLQVVAGMGNPYTPYVAEPEDLPAFVAAMQRAWHDWQYDKDHCQRFNRGTAETHFDVAVTAQKFVNLFKEVKEAA